MSQSPSLSQPVVDYDPRPRPRKSPSAWMNWRIWLFVAVIAVPIGMLTYTYVHNVVTQGIVHGADGTEVDLKAMSLFPFDQQFGTDADVPPRFRELDGQKVVLVGEMYAPSSASPVVRQFDLVYSISKCCFSGPTQVQHFVKSSSATNDPMPYYGGEVRVKGTLKVKVVRAEGKVASVYNLSVDSIEPL